MNIYAVIILAAIIIDFLLGLIADTLNIRNMSPNLPAEFKDTFDQEKYRKSQKYTRVNTRFGLISDVFDVALILVFWFAGGFNWLDQLVRSVEWPPIWTGILFIGALGVAKSILVLPFSIYQTFVIEERFGFNKTTVKTFVLDLLKGLLLTILIGIPILAGILAIFEYVGVMAWFYAWIGITLVSLALQYIAPTWIMPLFNKFTPLEEGELKEKILNYAEKVNYPLAGVYVIDGSRRSAKSNAFFTGFGKNKRIALFDTLIEQHTSDELLAVLAHEIGHYKKKHIIRNMIFGILNTGVTLYLLSIFITHQGLFEAFYMKQQSVYAGLLFFGMLYAPIEMLLSPVLNVFSRKFEYQADRFAVETTDKHESMVDALKKLSVNNLSNLTPHPFYVKLHYSHPPVLKRIRAIRAIEYQT